MHEIIFEIDRADQIRLESHLGRNPSDFSRILASAVRLAR